MSPLPGRAMRFWLFPYFLRNIRVNPRLILLITFLFQSFILNRMSPRILSCISEMVKACKQLGLEFEKRRSQTWVFLRTCLITDFYRMAPGVIHRNYGNPSNEMVILGQFFCAISSGASLVSISGGSHTLIQRYEEYLGKSCTKGLLDYPISDIRLLKRCFQRTASWKVGTLDAFLMTEIIVAHLQCAQHRDWMQSHQTLRMAIETGDSSMPGLMDVVSNMVEVWPFIVS